MGGYGIGPDPRLADDGKRLDSQSRAGSCMRRRSQKNIFRKGRGLGRGGSIVGPYSRVADDGKRLGLSESALDVAIRLLS